MTDNIQKSWALFLDGNMQAAKKLMANELVFRF